MFKKWVEEHFELFEVVLLILAALNVWIGGGIFTVHPIMAFANGAMAIVLLVGVILLWGRGRPK